jgi:hypothetical protein
MRIFTDKMKIQIFLSKIASYLFFKDFQATGETSGPLKTIFSASKHKISSLFSHFIGQFCLPDPDPAPQNKLNPDPIRGARTRQSNTVQGLDTQYAHTDVRKYSFAVSQ